MSGLAIDTLRLRGAPSGSTPDPHALLAAVEPRSEDRRVLIVRRLTVALADPEEAKEHLEAVRRHAARPAIGPVAPGAEAVEFADQAEVLLCLSRDVLRGVASQHWWWVGRLPSYCPSIGETLAVLWTQRARWVPTVLAALAEEDVHLERHAVTELGHAAAAVLEAVVAEFPAQRRLTSELTSAETGPPATLGVPPPEPYADPGVTAVMATRAADALLAVAAAVTGSRRAARSLKAAVPAGPLSTPGSPTLPAGLPPAARRESTPADSLVTSVRAASVPVATPRRTVAQEPPQEPPDEPPDQPDAEVTDLEHERARRRGVSPPDRHRDQRADESAGDQGDGIRPLPTWAGSGPAIDSEMATLLYAVNLVRWFGLDTLVEPTATAWGTVEALGRLLLQELPPAQWRALEQDPLLGLLADLDGRPDRGPTEVTIGAAIRPVRRWLATHHVTAATFARPGRIVVSRTHVDVVLSLDSIDLAARTSGLDQDPGWVPSLARIVLFHFED